MPTDIRGMHTNQVLTQISLKYRNQDLIADRVCPVIRVLKESDLYGIFGKESFSVPNMERAPRAEYAEVGMSASTDTYSCREYGIQTPIDDRERSNTDSWLDLQASTTELLTDKLLLGREIRVAAAMQATGTFANASPSTKWDVSSATPIADVAAARAAVRDAIGMEPNLMVLPKCVLDSLMQVTEIIDRIKYAQLGVLTVDLLQTLFNVRTIVLAGARKNTAQEGDTEALSDVWSDTTGLYYVNPNPGPKMMSCAHTFRSGALVVDQYRRDDIKSDVFRVSMVEDVKVICAGAGYLLTDCNT